ncbi:Fc.00g011650.m01.CDS01 [Cosmosporella sp. VM-42]
MNSTTESSWVDSLDTPPAREDGFAVVNNEFLAMTGHRTYHRRATGDEPRAFYASCDGHYPRYAITPWFEAQLRHYRFEPTLFLSQVTDRLYGACAVGNPAQPTYLRELEDKLRRKWTEMDNLARTATEASSAMQVYLPTTLQGSWNLSHENVVTVEFYWRGRADVWGAKDQIMYPGHAGQIWFSGGSIAGSLDFMSSRFEGERTSGHKDSSQVVSRRIQDEWARYAKEYYEQKGVAAWVKSLSL